MYNILSQLISSIYHSIYRSFAHDLWLNLGHSKVILDLDEVLEYELKNNL